MFHQTWKLCRKVEKIMKNLISNKFSKFTQCYNIFQNQPYFKNNPRNLFGQMSLKNTLTSIQ